MFGCQPQEAVVGADHRVCHGRQGGGEKALVARLLDAKLTEVLNSEQHRWFIGRMSPAEARYEIFESKKQLEAIINEKIRHFAYPNGESGDFSTEHQELVARAGYESACCTILGLNDTKTNRFALRRVYASEEPLANFAARLVGVGS